MKRLALLALVLLLLPASARAALDVAQGQITITTGGAGTTFPVSGLSFQPEALYFFWSGRATVGTAEGDAKMGHGIAVSTSSRRAYGSQSDHAVGTSATDSMWRNDACVVTLTTLGAVDGLADLSAIASDGFTLIVDDAFGAAIVVSWIAWGGTDLTNASITDFTEVGSVTTQDINVGFALNTGLDDKALIILGGVDAAANTTTTDAAVVLGFAAGDTPVNTVCTAAADDAAATTITFCYCRTGEVTAGHSAVDAVVARSAVTVWLSTGFRLSWTESASALFRFSVLALKGGRWQAGDALTDTGTGNVVEATSYQPKSLLIASHAKAASTANTTQNLAEISIGMAASVGSQAYADWLDDDPPTIVDVGIGHASGAIYRNIDDTALNKGVQEGLMSIISYDATPSFTYAMSDADVSQNYFMWLLGADTPAAGGCTPTLTLLGVGRCGD